MIHFETYFMNFPLKTYFFSCRISDRPDPKLIISKFFGSDSNHIIPDPKFSDIRKLETDRIIRNEYNPRLIC